MVTSGEQSLETLRARFSRGERLEFVFFWGHEERHGAPMGKACLSQWYPAPFTVDGLLFPTAEHFMMHGKAKLFGDEESAEAILRAPSPGAVKALGRGVRGFDEAIWQRNRSAIVIAGSRAKFAQSPTLRDYLLSTQGRVLVEASPVDRVWGIGLSADDEHAENPLEWRGLNLLGFALMQVRDA